MKFVLVINVADDVVEAYEDFTIDYDLRGTPKEDRTVNESIKYVEDADVRPLPQKMTMEKALKMERCGAIKDIYTTWDACLAEIAGETE